MKFNESLLFRMISEFPRVWNENDLYHFIFKVPYLIMVLTGGVLIALIVDFLCANGMKN